MFIEGTTSACEGLLWAEHCVQTAGPALPSSLALVCCQALVLPMGPDSGAKLSWVPTVSTMSMKHDSTNNSSVSTVDPLCALH